MLVQVSQRCEIPAPLTAHAQQTGAHGKVERGRPGVTIQPLSPKLVKSFGITQPDGELVSDVALW